MATNILQCKNLNNQCFDLIFNKATDTMEVEKAYKILHKTIPGFKKLYDSSEESWCTIFEIEEKEYAVYGNTYIRKCETFLVIELMEGAAEIE